MARTALNYTHNFKNNSSGNLGFTTCLLWEGDYQGLGPLTSPAKLSVYQIQNQYQSMPVELGFYFVMELESFKWRLINMIMIFKLLLFESTVDNGFGGVGRDKQEQ